MAILFGSQIDLQKIPVKGIVAESSATGSPPATPVNGQFWFDTTVGRLYVREAGAWVLASNTGTEQTVNKGATSGYASLDGSTKVPIAQIPTGTSGTTVPFGNDSRFSDSRAPSGSAGGDLTGTYPNPTVALLAITDGKVAAANKDGLIAVPSLRTLGYTGLSAMPGIARLDQIAVPTAAVSMNSQLLTNLLDPVSAQDAATKSYVDAARAGLDVKQSVRATSTANVTVTYSAAGGASSRGQITAAPNTLDGVTLAANNRVLLKDQTAGAQNGIWVVTTLGSGANGVWDRATDFDADAEVTSGAFVFVEEGTVNDNSGWTLITNNPIIIGGASGTVLAWALFSSVGTILDGAGLVKTGNTLDVVGTANRITVLADSVDISSAYVGQASITTLGTVTAGVWNGTDIAVADGGTGAGTAAAARTNLGAMGRYSATLGAITGGSELTITHSLNSTEVLAQFRDATSNFETKFAWRVIDANSIGLTADLSYSASAIKAVVMG